MLPVFTSGQGTFNAAMYRYIRKIRTTFFSLQQQRPCSPPQTTHLEFFLCFSTGPLLIAISYHHHGDYSNSHNGHDYDCPNNQRYMHTNDLIRRVERRKGGEA